jgi:hypothetical protein
MIFVAILGGAVVCAMIVAFLQAGVVYTARSSILSYFPGESYIRLVLLHPDLAFARVLDRIARNPVRWALAQVALGVLFGGITFSLVEHGQSIPDGLWWAFVSMSTVGYGDISPKSDFERFLAVFVIANGIAATAILTAALAGRIAERRMAHHEVIETPELGDDIELLRQSLRDHYADFDAHCERLQILVNHPRVVEALREVHSEGGTS